MLVALFVILVVYPLTRSIFFIGSSMTKQESIDTVLLFDTFLLTTLGFLFYQAFQGAKRVKIPIVILVTITGAFRILAALVVTIFMGTGLSLLGWVITGIVEIGLGLVMLKSVDIEAYIASRAERNARGR